MASMIECTCQNKRCKKRFMARVADRKRGWGKFCSKSCKAVKQEARTGQHREFLRKDTNFRNSGVSRERYLNDMEEHGGYPQYSRSGEFEGVALAPEDMGWEDD